MRMNALKGKLNADDAIVRESVALAKERQAEAQAKAEKRAKKRGKGVWVEAYDPTEDKFYYSRKYKDKMGEERWETVWEKPRHYIMAADDETMAAAIKIQCLWRKRIASRKLQATLATKRKKVMDPHLFAAVRACIDEAEAKIARIEEHGGERWKERFDEKTERYYYEGEMSEDKTWTKPLDYVMVAAEDFVAATITIQLQWRGKMCRDQMSKALNQKNRGLTRKEKEWIDGIMEKIHTEQERITLVHGCHWVEVYDPEKEQYRFQDLVSGRSSWGQPKYYVMACEVDVLISVIRVQGCWRCKVARRRCALQVELLESRAVGFSDPFLDFDYPQPIFSNQCTFVDDSDYNPVPIVAAPPQAPGVPGANGISASQVHLKWEQPASTVPITFCTIKIRPVLQRKDDRDREFEVETPAQIGWAETTVEVGPSRAVSVVCDPS
jgi:hypothetical protein